MSLSCRLDRNFRHAVADPRDFDFCQLQARLKVGTAQPTAGGGKIRILVERTPIGDQANSLSCWSNATADAIEQVMPDPVVQVSRLDLHWKARRAVHEEGSDTGVDPRAALGAACKLGICREELWPFDLTKINERPPLAALEEGYDHKIHAYYVIKAYGQARIDQLVSAIDGDLPIVFGTDVGPEIDETDGQTALDPPRRVEGGHAMVVWGYWMRPDGSIWFRIRNSWGKDWGDQGYCWFSSAYLTDVVTSGFFVPTGSPIFVPKSGAPDTLRSPA